VRHGEKERGETAAAELRGISYAETALREMRQRDRPASPNFQILQSQSRTGGVAWSCPGLVEGELVSGRHAHHDNPRAWDPDIAPWTTAPWLDVATVGRMGPLVGGRREVTERRVPTPRVVPALEKLEERRPVVSVGAEALSVEQLALEGGEEALAQGVVVGVAYTSHRGPDAGLATPCLVASVIFGSAAPGYQRARNRP